MTISRWPLVAASAVAIMAATMPATSLADTRSPTLVEEQRRVFQEVYPQAELGNWRPAAKYDQLLRGYVLWPELRGAWLRTRVRNRDFSDVVPFLDKYGTLKPARELRYHYALALGRSGDHTQYFDLYQRFFQGLEVTRLDCLALQAELAAGREKRIVNRGIDKWLIGKNQVDECDPVFDNLRDRGILDTVKYQNRFELAITARQFPLARYLARSLPVDYQASAKQWSAVVADPVAFLESNDKRKDDEDHRSQLLYAAQRVAYKQPDLAAKLWRSVRGRYAFSAAQLATVERHLALWAARQQTDNALVMLDSLADDAVDAEVRRWRVRMQLRQHNWNEVIAAIDEMSVEERDDEQWRYWRARANLELGNKVAASAEFELLALERSFYGFLAADQQQLDYAFSDRRLVANPQTIGELQNSVPLIRAHELFLVGLDGRGRSEWDAAVSMFSAEQKRQASILAHQWGWHSRAIATAATIGEFDDLELRYPLPYPETFAEHASGSNIKRSWALGIARSESLFMRDIRSSAGAVGLMQLMPDTARRTAKKINLKYAGQVTLTDPDSNIRLGTAYLRLMMERFDFNQVLATAAYNAGPLNVENWLPADGEIEALIWIENIPYNETRKYVRRVLATEAIFHWRLTGETKRLSPLFTAIGASSNQRRMANSN